MQTFLMLGTAFHVLTAVFWAGSTFALARSAAMGAERLWKPQLGAAALTIVSGGYLWSVFHRSQFGSSERVLAIGVIAALAALALQIIIGFAAARPLGRWPADPILRKRVAIIQGIAAPLLALTIICMAISRYV